MLTYFINGIKQLKRREKQFLMILADLLLLPFSLWDFQEDALQDFLDKSYNIVLKARQLGLSTLCAAYGAWMANFFKNKEIYILATTLSRRIFQKPNLFTATNSDNTTNN